jgi:hypothetical protein
MFSIGCTTEHPRPPLPAQSPAPVATVVDSMVVTPPAASGSFPDSESAPIDPIFFLDTAEMTALRTSEGKASRLGRELHIQLLDGKTVTFRDQRSPHYLLPRYAGYLKTIHSHVVHGVPMEGSGYYQILDDSTGDSTFVNGVPVPSPDGKRFVAMSMADAGAGYDPGLIQVWRMVGRKPEEEFSLDTENLPWQPSNPVWRDSSTVDFVKYTFVSFSEPYIKTPGRMIRSGNSWILPDSVSPPQ